MKDPLDNNFNRNETAKKVNQRIFTVFTIIYNNGNYNILQTSSIYYTTHASFRS